VAAIQLQISAVLDGGTSAMFYWPDDFAHTYWTLPPENHCSTAIWAPIQLQYGWQWRVDAV